MMLFDEGVRLTGGHRVRIERTSISLIICAYTLDRWNDLIAAVASARRHTLVVSQPVIVTDRSVRIGQVAASARLHGR